MAADDDKAPEPDPWADILADSLDADAAGNAFQFEADAKPVEGDETGTAQPAATAAETTDDDAAQAWLAEPEVERTESVVAEPTVPISADIAAGGSAIEIGTGLSGIDGLEADEADDADDAAADDMLAAVERDSAEGEAWGDFGAPVGGEAEEVAAEEEAANADAEASGFDFAEAAAGAGAAVVGAAAAAAAPAAPRKAKTAPRKQSGGIGQMIGVVAGGAMAIPITLAILIWGLQKDPFGVTKMVPEQAAFLLPQKFRPGFKKAKAAAGMPKATVGSPLDAVGATDDAPPAEPVTEEAAAPAEGLPVADLPLPDLAADLTTTEPATSPADDVPADAAATDLGTIPGDAGIGQEPAADVAVDTAADASPAPAAPGIDEVAAIAAPGLDSLPSEPAAPPEPPPLDTAALDAALAEARALGEALAAVEDRSTRPAKLLTVQWYQSLARVAEQLASLERAAADSGRPLAAMPEQVADFHAALIGGDPELAVLARVAWDWLAFRKRQGDGVVLPVTFASARRVGPYWSATATLDKGDGARRVLSIVSRSEPAAVAGDRLLVTGLVLAENVVWAVDARATAGGSNAPGSEPGFEPAAETPVEPPAEPAVEPAVEPAGEPGADPAAEQPGADEPSATSDAGTESEAVVEPAVEPAAEPAAQPAVPF